jgi:septum formation protein
VVVGEGESAVQLGKPADAVEAAAMLARLSGTRHRVLTGVAVVEAQGERSESAVEVTWVTMRHLSAAEQAAYVATGEWQDKAGGYAIQESADAFVTSLEGGGFDNVVGLPVPLTLTLLKRMGFSGLAGGGGRQ